MVKNQHEAFDLSTLDVVEPYTQPRLFTIQQVLSAMYDSDRDEQDVLDNYPENNLESEDIMAMSCESEAENDGEVGLDLDVRSRWAWHGKDKQTKT